MLLAENMLNLIFVFVFKQMIAQFVLWDTGKARVDLQILYNKEHAA